MYEEQINQNLTKASSSSFLLEKEPLVLRELSRLGPSIRPRGELLSLPFDEEEADLLCQTARPSTPTLGMVCWSQELKDESEASKEAGRQREIAWIWLRNCPLPARLGGGQR